MADRESEKERVDRELLELLNELRVALPGVQVLFAFLLIVPFSNGWKQTSDLERDVYVFAVLATALSTLLLIAPSAHHRVEFRAGDKEHLLRLANRLAIAGTAVLALAISAVVFLVASTSSSNEAGQPHSARSPSPPSASSGSASQSSAAGRKMSLAMGELATVEKLVLAAGARSRAGGVMEPVLAVYAIPVKR